MDFKLLNKQRKWVIIGSLAGIISCFLPWYNYGIGSINGLNGLGILVFLFFIICTVIAFMGDYKQHIPSNTWLIVVVAAMINIVIVGYYIIRFLTATQGGVAERFGGMSFGIGFGIWISAASAILVALTSYLFKSATVNIKDALNAFNGSLKNSMQHSSDTERSGKMPPQP
ncbi:MAG: hypothetical protein JST17_15375 [Bacteroidetes bacterium]|nr:hypothetical protein [Bacteroidota bacterium]MBS1930565.1 hypothetical protein [Bacteroidota bacterium]